MPPPRIHSDAELLDEVRSALAENDDLSIQDVRRRTGGTTALVGAAVRATKVERGELPATTALDPRFAGLIRRPAASQPVNVQPIPSELVSEVGIHFAAARGAFEAIVQRILEASSQDVQAADTRATAAYERVEQQAARDGEHIDCLRRELAESDAQTDRVRAETTAAQSELREQVARLSIELHVAQTRGAWESAEVKKAVTALGELRGALTDARERAERLERELAVANERGASLDASVGNLEQRLRRAEQDATDARAAAMTSSAAAAAARATLEARESLRKPRGSRSPSTSPSKAGSSHSS